MWREGSEGCGEERKLARSLGWEVESEGEGGRGVEGLKSGSGA